MAVPFAAAGSVPEMGAPKALFHPRILNGGASVVGVNWQYDAAPDGRFLNNVIVGDTVARSGQGRRKPCECLGDGAGREPIEGTGRRRWFTLLRLQAYEGTVQQALELALMPMYAY